MRYCQLVWYVLAQVKYVLYNGADIRKPANVVIIQKKKTSSPELVRPNNRVFGGGERNFNFIFGGERVSVCRIFEFGKGCFVYGVPNYKCL